MPTRNDANHHDPAPSDTDAAGQRRHEEDASADAPPEQSADAGFYWDLPDDDAARLRRENLILEHEGYLAHDILWGRRLLDLRQPYVPVPDVDRDWTAPGSSERFSDAISAILQVAVRAGLDPGALCAEALATRQGVENYSVAACSHRGRGRTRQ